MASSSSEPPTPPPFAFKILEVRETKGGSTRMIDGTWHPPVQRGASRHVGSETWGKYYLCDFENLKVARELDSNYKEYNTCTVYTDGHGHIWSVPRDATMPQIGSDSGTEDSDEDEDNASVEGQSSTNEQNPNWVSWRSLTFEHPNPGTINPSILTHGGEHDHLHIHSPNQMWVTSLLSRRYRGPLSSNTNGRGGLVGELRLIIALIALFASPEGNRVEQALVECMGDGNLPWRAPEGTVRGHLPGRGVVVTIYIWHGWDANVESLERGGYVLLTTFPIKAAKLLAHLSA